MFNKLIIEYNKEKKNKKIIYSSHLIDTIGHVLLDVHNSEEIVDDPVKASTNIENVLRLFHNNFLSNSCLPEHSQ